MENDDLQQELDRVLADFVPGTARTVTAAPTTSYKGLNVPSNSALLKQDTSVLAAYKSLLVEDSTNANGNVPSIIDAQLSALPLFITAPNSLSFNVQLLINTLPVLDNLATQILRIITKGPYQKVMELVSNRESSYSGIAFSNLVELFETTKRVYNSEESPFFTVENITFGLWRFGEHSPLFLRGREDTIEGTLRKVNLSTFLLATLGLIDLGFFFLNEAFLDVFCPPQNLDPSESLSNIKQSDAFVSNDANHLNSNSKIFTQQRASTKFLKAQALLYLELKTQAYISALELGDRSREEIISDLFPEILPELLLRRRDSDWKAKLNELNGGLLSTIVPNGDSKINNQIVNKVKVIFTPAEYDFLQRCTLRKSSLLKESMKSNESNDGEPVNLSLLMEKYEWVRFLNDLLDYVSRNVGFLIWGPKGKISMEIEKRKMNLAKNQNNNQGGGVLNSIKIEEKNNEIENDKNDDVAAPPEKLETVVNKTVEQSQSKIVNNDNVVAQREINQIKPTQISTTATSVTATPATVTTPSVQQSTTNKRTSAEAELDPSTADLSDGTETPLDVEQLTDLNTPINKPSAAKRSKNRPATFRRVWTEEEESALREGLKVKGTQWTSILELFGPGGRINESLKNRTSLQLKDKARNWKLWYIKNHVEIPAWLKGASGGSHKGVSRPGTPVDGGSDSNNGKSNDISKPPTGKSKKYNSKSKNGESKSSKADQEQQKEHEEVSEDQYDEMLSLLAKSADNNDVIETNSIVEELSRTSTSDNVDKSIPKELENDDHAELKNLVAEAFQQ